MRKIRVYLPILVVVGLIVTIVSLALAGNAHVNKVMSEAGSGLGDGVSSYIASASLDGKQASAAPTATTASAARGSLGLSEGPGYSMSTDSNPRLDAVPAAGGAPPLHHSASGAVSGALDYSSAMTATGGAPLPGGDPAPPNPSDHPAQGSNNQPSQDQNPLLASQVDDNAAYTAFLSYVNGYSGARTFAPDLSERYFVQVTNSQQRPVADATVDISSTGQALYSAHTGSDGRVVFFPRALQGAANAQKFDISVHRDQASAQTSLVRGSGNDTAPITLAIAPDSAVNLDVVFLIDSTGSMDDEIAKIKSSVHNIAERISQLPSAPHLRLALVTYRDRGADNEYVTHKWDFTTDVNTFANELNTLVAYNGGDYPEDINAGLLDTISLPGWGQSNSHNLRLVFLVGDAPPHLDYPDEQQYPTLSQMAASKGIKIFPIAASGLDDSGEFIFRNMAAMTLGKFVFLTYAPAPNGAPSNGGNPGDTTQMHVANYQTNNFDDVVVSLVSQEVANQTAPKAAQGGGANLIAVDPPLAHMDTLLTNPTPKSVLPWLMALGWLPLLAGGLLIYRRSQRARVATTMPARRLDPQPTTNPDWTKPVLIEPKAIEAASPYVYIRPARYWASALGEQPTSRLDG